MSIVNILQTSSLIGMTFCGYHYYPYIQTFINGESFNPIKTRFLDFRDNRYISEDIFCKVVSSLIGTAIGHTFYPFGVAYTLYFTDKTYGQKIKKYLKEIQKK
jgi:hypothetical protein